MKNDTRVDGDVTYIKLTQGQETVIDTQDLPLVEGYRWCANKIRDTYYAFTNTPYKTRMHQVLIPGAKRVDHIDGNGLNNRRDNIRASNAQLNSVNSGKARVNASSRFKGVAYRSKGRRRWRAYGVKDGRQFYLGMHLTEIEAARAYDAWAEEAFQGHARLNRNIYPDVMSAY